MFEVKTSVTVSVVVLISPFFLRNRDRIIMGKPGLDYDEDVLKHVGGFGKWQKMLFVLQVTI